MANVMVDPPLYAATLNAANTNILRDPANGVVNTWVIDLRSTSFVGSITIKGRLAGTANAFVAIPYHKRYLNGLVGDDTSVSTAITADSLIYVDATGLDIAVDVTAYTSGSMAMQAQPAQG